jgi:very-short-patch-repair endonuclease
MSKFSNFIKYYRDCVFEDSSDAIFASTDSTESYIKITGEELSKRDPIEFTESEIINLRTFIYNTLEHHNNASFWYGYPILFIKKGVNSYIKPVFYIPIRFDEDKKPEIDSNLTPRINNEAFSDLGIEFEEIKGFAEDINLYNNDNFIDLSTLGDLLKDKYPDLNYNKKDNNNKIFFKGVVFSSEQSKYTKGLDDELNKLLRLDKLLSNSCLKYYINPQAIKTIGTDNAKLSNLLEVFELNENQKKAVRLSFKKYITVITGPPGTGKSQVVASLILNSILSNQKVLFASKNHKAIKVVEEKFNNLIGYPFLIRLGKRDNEGNDLKINLVRYLNWLLHTNPSDDIEDKIRKCEKELNELIIDRNKIISEIEELRLLRNKTLLYFKINQNKYNYTISFQELIEKIKSKKGVKRKNLLNCKIKNVSQYLKKMNDVHKLSSFEELLDKNDNFNHKIKELSYEFIKLWFESFPKKIDFEQKKNIDNFIAVLESLMVDNLSKKQIYDLMVKMNSLQNKVSEFLQSWCVTNLSIKGEMPLIEGFFDLLIIDEASQCDIASVIPLLFRSKRVVVLGDPFQLKHISTISPKRSIELLKENNLEDNYNYISRSFFDISQTIAEKSSMVFLNEHFRSHADIISFSKNYSSWYDGRLLISTDYRRLNPKPSIYSNSIDWVDIQGPIKQINSSGAFINEEVDAVVNKAVEILNYSDFNGDLGIITPFRLQANEIRTKLHYKLNNIQRNRVLVETTIKFQGDEKDIIIFSPVISKLNPKGVNYYLKNTDHLLNVAITRARSKLIIVGNKQACLESKIKHYQDFAKYVEGILSGEIQNIENKAESIYEELLHKALLNAQIDPIPQFVIGQYRLDFAIIKNDLKIDIEVDGKQYHTDWSGDQLKADIVRNQRLQNLGWKVIRFWSYEIRDNIDYCINRIRLIINE